MNRRNFINLIPSVFLPGIPFQDRVKNKNSNVLDSTVIIDGTQVEIYSKSIKNSLVALLVSDTHLTLSDYREDQYRQYSDRMAKAYISRKHFLTGKITTPEESFMSTLNVALLDLNIDLFIMIGDIFSFPTEAAIEWVFDKVDNLGIPFIYIAGNHDWHYEGMEGSEHELREFWTKERLLPLYQGNNPLFAAYDLNGIRFVAIDNSTYEITNEQLNFFRSQVKLDSPIVLLVHIPLYMPGRPRGFGCGHPDWGAEMDPYYRIERRPQWPISGHTKTTFDFHDEVFNANNLLGFFDGHTHN